MAKKKNPHAVALGKIGGAKGGKVRAAKLSPALRTAKHRAQGMLLSLALIGPTRAKLGRIDRLHRLPRDHELMREALLVSVGRPPPRGSYGISNAIDLALV